jgi:transcriptional repressor NrdR
MKCPYCGFLEDKVIDSRPTDEGSAIRRRRECNNCGKRFTTYEKVESIPLMVVKKDGARESFDREKILNGILRACEKRPVSLEQMESLVEEVESQIRNSLKREITTQEIGELVMSQLKDLDEVAYVRFASVYRQFKDINTFMDELKKLLK